MAGHRNACQTGGHKADQKACAVMGWAGTMYTSLPPYLLLSGTCSVTRLGCKLEAEMWVFLQPSPLKEGHSQRTERGGEMREQNLKHP